MGRRRRLLGKKSNTVLTQAPAPAPKPPEGDKPPEADAPSGADGSSEAERASTASEAPPQPAAPPPAAPPAAAAPPPEAAPPAASAAPPPAPAAPPEPPPEEDPGVAGLAGAVGVPEPLPDPSFEQPSGFADALPSDLASSPPGMPAPMGGMGGFDPLGDALMGGAGALPDAPSPPRDLADTPPAATSDSSPPSEPVSDGSDWVSEAEYTTGTHEIPPVDTTDEGWDDDQAAHHRPPPTPTGPPVDLGGGEASGLLNKLKGGTSGDPSDYSAPAAPPISTPDMPLFGDDVLGPGESTAGLMGSADPTADFTSDEPPTEEVPSAVLQDLSQLYNAPMDVPQPPPMPGIFDDPGMGGPLGGPPPLGGAPQPPSSGDPFARSEPPSGAEPFAQPPASSRPGLPTTQPPDEPIAYDEEDDEWDDEDSDEDEAPFGLSRTAFLALAGGISVLAAMIIVGTVIVLTAGGAAVSASSGTATDAPPPMDKPPVTAPTGVPSDTPPVDGPDEPGAEGEGEGDGADDTDEATPEEPVAEEPPPAPVKDRTPVRTPTKKKVTKPPPKPDASGKGTLKVRSNKRVLVMVDGRPVDFSPLELPLAAGKHTISAMQPGRRDTKKDQEVTIESGKVADIEFTF